MKIIIIFILTLFSLKNYGQQYRIGEIANFSSKTYLIPFENRKESALDCKALLNYDGPITIFFWLSTCSICIKELNNFKKMNDFKLIENRSKIIVVSEDSPKKYGVAKMISKKNQWEFNMFFDKNYRLRNSLLNRWYGVPQVMIIDKNKKIILHKIGYKKGDEKIIFEKIKRELKM